MNRSVSTDKTTGSAFVLLCFARKKTPDDANDRERRATIKLLPSQNERSVLFPGWVRGSGVCGGVNTSW